MCVQDFDFGVSGGKDDLNRRDFCSTIAAMATVGPMGMMGPEKKPMDKVSSVIPDSSPIAESFHKIFFEAAQKMGHIEDASVNLVVTSPPYPMIEMWDEIFALQNRKISTALDKEPLRAFELMHGELDKVWGECFRVLKDGGFMCVNIGDATRTINKDFNCTITILESFRLALRRVSSICRI